MVSSKTQHFTLLWLLILGSLGLSLLLNKPSYYYALYSGGYLLAVTILYGLYVVLKKYIPKKYTLALGLLSGLLCLFLLSIYSTSYSFNHELPEPLILHWMLVGIFIGLLSVVTIYCSLYMNHEKASAFLSLGLGCLCLYIIGKQGLQTYPDKIMAITVAITSLLLIIAYSGNKIIAYFKDQRK